MSDEHGIPRLRWGILSTARITEEVAPGLLNSDRNQLACVASRDAARAKSFADRFGISVAYDSYEQLLADDTVHAVYIPLPNALHGQWVRRALQHGKHVLCEKPLVETPVEAQELFSLANERGLHLAEAFMYRHHPKTQIIRDIVRSGQIGEIHTIRSSFCFMTDDPVTDIRFNPALAGGALRDVGSYCVSMSNYLMDAEPAAVQAMATLAGSGVAERFYAAMRYQGGAVSLFDCSMRSPASVGLSVLGEAGEIVVPMPWYSHREPRSVIVRREGCDDQVIWVPATNAYFLETEHFAETVLAGRSPEIAAHETIRNLATIIRLQESVPQA